MFRSGSINAKPIPQLSQILILFVTILSQGQVKISVLLFRICESLKWPMN